jgi:hypothetical protein
MKHWMLGKFSAALTEHLVAKYTEQLSDIVCGLYAKGEGEQILVCIVFIRVTHWARWCAVCFGCRRRWNILQRRDGSVP